MNRAPLPLSKIAAYALPVFAIGLVLGPVTAFLPGLYAKHAAVSLTAIGTLFAVARIFDALTDPLIGYLSDNTRGGLGPRVPWVVAGGLIATIASFALFRIPPDAGIGYFGFWSLLFYLGYTMFWVPHMAWGSEITTDHVQRARVFTVRALADSLGGIVYNVLPLLLVYLAVTRSTEFSPDVFRVLGWAVLLVLPLSLLVAARAAPAAELRVVKTDGIGGLYRCLRDNKLLARFMAAFVLGGINSGLVGVLTFPFFDGYLGLGETLPMLLIAAYVAQVVALPFWQKVMEWCGKHNTWAIGWASNSLVMLPLLLVTPGGEHTAAIAIGCLFLFGFTAVVSAVAPLALMGDIVDYEVLRSGVDRAGNFYAFMLLVAKIAGAAGGVAFIVLGAVFGYELGEGVVNSDAANRGMALMYCVVPGLIQLLALPLILRFPLDQRRHDIVLRRLERLRERHEVS